MKVLYLTNLPAPYRMRFFEKLGNLCDLTAVIERKTANDRDAKWFEQNINRTFKYIALKGIQWNNDSGFSPSVLRWLRKRQFDIIVIGGYSSPTEILAILYMRLRGIPFVLSADGGFAVKGESAIRKKIKQILIGSASHWLASGKGTAEFLEFYGADSERTFLYPFTSVENGDIMPEALEEPEKGSYKRILGLDGKQVVLSIGQFIPRKGFDILLDAWNRLPHDNDMLAVIGGGPLKAQYTDIISDLQIKNIMLLDFMKKKELLEWYRAADLFVLPTRYDIWGLVINEAMAQGLPVISTSGALAGLELVYQGCNGYIVPINEAGALASCIGRLLNDRTLRKHMSECAIETIKPYTIENMAISHMKAFEAILGKS